MRVQIKTKQPIKDPWIKALYITAKAMEVCPDDHARKAMLTFFADKIGFELVQKGGGQ